MSRIADSNVPADPLRWSVGRASAEFNLAQQTLERRLRDAQAFPGAGGCYSTKQLTEAIFGSLFRERLRRMTEEADRVAMANKVARAQLLSRAEFEKGFAQLADALAGVVKNSNLDRRSKEDFLKNLSSWPVVLRDTAAAQSRLPNATDPKAEG